ncbi:hypothetical protein PCANC_04737 [Puccinia coronata f. sp. avenae]|uniref:Uncharacterized protein n=1 Tax=Puccinia coronata f. sp. avenae TaxID=200324 RepID=A0A2N5S042_9BASI|nr:hypothetical protein PCANC_28656 [Puccinia coronata f. sp. avenae]PLW35144.1 hypothetical protein PCASD_11252 [Puccinia coronata f. sp. avenae]PLW54417.1 hypothetical protein PCANC_04737 [Puccinia coronata f. sp. avenae]
MKHTPPPTKKTPTGTQGQPPAGSTGTGSTGATSTTSSSATSGTSSTTSTQRPSLSLGFDNTTPQQHQHCFFSSHQNPPPPPPIFDYAADPRNRNAISKEAAARFAMDDDKLQADGSNFRSWLNEITEFAIMSLDDPTFFNHPQPADAKETVA